MAIKMPELPFYYSVTEEGRVNRILQHRMYFDIFPILMFSVLILLPSEITFSKTIATYQVVETGLRGLSVILRTTVRWSFANDFFG